MNSKISMPFSRITDWSQYIFNKKIYCVAQLAGFLLILLLTVIVLLLDRLVILDLPFTWNCKEWHPVVYQLMGCVVAFLILEVIFWLIKKKNNKSKGLNISWKLQRNGDKPSWKQKIMMLISTSCSGNAIDICFVISFFFYIAWIPDSCSDLVKGDSSIWRCILYIIGLLALVWIKPTVYRDKKEVDNDKRTLLISGLSYIKRKPMETIQTTIKPFERYKKIEEIMIVLSNHLELDGKFLPVDLSKPNDSLEKAYKRYKYKMADLYFERYNETNEQQDLERAITNADKEKVIKNYEVSLNFCKEWKVELTNKDKEGVLNKYKLVFDLALDEERDLRLRLGVEETLKDFITACIKASYNVNFERKNIKFTVPVDYNDFDDCNTKCYDKLLTIMKSKYSDENIIVNITAGTSPITSALTLNAIKGNREMVYVNQNSKQLEKANPNVMMFVFDELWTERVEHE